MSGLPLWVLRPTGLSWQLGWREVAGDRRPKGGLGWLIVAGTVQTLYRARNPTSTSLLDLCPAGSPHRPTRLPHSSRLGSRLSLRNGRCGPGRGLCQKQEVLPCGLPSGSPDAHPGCEPSLTTLGVKGRRIRKIGLRGAVVLIQGGIKGSVRDRNSGRLLEWEVKRI